MWQFQYVCSTMCGSPNSMCIETVVTKHLKCPNIMVLHKLNQVSRKMIRENNFTRTIWTRYSAEYLKCKAIQGIGQYIRQNIIEVLWWVVSTTTQECNSFDKHHNMLLHSSEIIKIFLKNIQFNILNVTSQTVFLGFLCDIEAGDLPCFVDKFTVELENP